MKFRKVKITTGRKVVDYLIIVSVLAIFVVVGIYVSRREKTLILSNVVINIEDKNEHSFLKTEEVMAVVEKQGIKVGEMLCSAVDVRTLKQTLSTIPYIKDVKCYVGYFRGVLYIDVEQFNPMFRIIDRDEKSYYVDEDGRVVLKNNSICYDVPVFTNNYSTLFNAISKKSVKKDDNIEKLVTFVKYINEDDFLTSLITQINITESGWVEIVPCVGRQTIVLGKLYHLDSAPTRIYKIKAFYTKGRDLGLLDKYKKIDISRSNQIICTY